MTGAATLEPVLIAGEVNGGMWKGQCMGMGVQSVENGATFWVPTPSWVVAKLERGVWVGSSKVESVVSDCFILASIIWV